MDMKKKLMTLVLAVSMVFVMTGCGKSNAKEFTAGSVEGNVYTNTSVGITATIPDGMTLADDAAIQAMNENGAAQIAASNENISEEDLAKAQEAVVYEFVASTEDGSATIQVMGENTKVSSGRAVTADAYLTSVESTLKTTYENLGLSVNANKENTTIAGLEFVKDEISISGGMQGVTQDYYVYKMGDSIYSIALTYIEGAESYAESFISSITAITE